MRGCVRLEKRLYMLLWLALWWADWLALEDFSYSLRKLSEKPHERANLLAIRRLIAA